MGRVDGAVAHRPVVVGQREEGRAAADDEDVGEGRAVGDDPPGAGAVGVRIDGGGEAADGRLVAPLELVVGGLAGKISGVAEGDLFVEGIGRGDHSCHAAVESAADIDDLHRDGFPGGREGLAVAKDEGQVARAATHGGEGVAVDGLVVVGDGGQLLGAEAEVTAGGRDVGSRAVGAPRKADIFDEAFYGGGKGVDGGVPRGLVGVGVRGESAKGGEVRIAENIEQQVGLADDFIDELACENEFPCRSRVGIEGETLPQVGREVLKERAPAPGFGDGADRQGGKPLEVQADGLGARRVVEDAAGEVSRRVVRAGLFVEDLGARLAAHGGEAELGFGQGVGEFEDGDVGDIGIVEFGLGGVDELRPDRRETDVDRPVLEAAARHRVAEVGLEGSDGRGGDAGEGEAGLRAVVEAHGQFRAASGVRAAVDPGVAIAILEGEAVVERGAALAGREVVGDDLFVQAHAVRVEREREEREGGGADDAGAGQGGIVEGDSFGRLLAEDPEDADGGASVRGVFVFGQDVRLGAGGGGVEIVAQGVGAPGEHEGVFLVGVEAGGRGIVLEIDAAERFGGGEIAGAGVASHDDLARLIRPGDGVAGHDLRPVDRFEVGGWSRDASEPEKGERVGAGQRIDGDDLAAHLGGGEVFGQWVEVGALVEGVSLGREDVGGAADIVAEAGGWGRPLADVEVAGEGGPQGGREAGKLVVPGAEDALVPKPVGGLQEDEGAVPPVGAGVDDAEAGELEFRFVEGVLVDESGRVAPVEIDADFGAVAGERQGVESEGRGVDRPRELVGIAEAWPFGAQNARLAPVDEDVVGVGGEALGKVGGGFIDGAVGDEGGRLAESAADVGDEGEVAIDGHQSVAEEGIDEERGGIGHGLGEDIDDLDAERDARAGDGGPGAHGTEKLHEDAPLDELGAQGIGAGHGIEPERAALGTGGGGNLGGEALAVGDVGVLDAGRQRDDRSGEGDLGPKDAARAPRGYRGDDVVPGLQCKVPAGVGELRAPDDLNRAGLRGENLFGVRAEVVARHGSGGDGRDEPVGGADDLAGAEGGGSEPGNGGGGDHVAEAEVRDPGGEGRTDHGAAEAEPAAGRDGFGRGGVEAAGGGGGGGELTGGRSRSRRWSAFGELVSDVDLERGDGGKRRGEEGGGDQDRRAFHGTGKYRGTTWRGRALPGVRGVP